jgi:hypothetical protein
MKRARRNHVPAFKVKVALAARKVYHAATRVRQLWAGRCRV